LLGDEGVGKGGGSGLDSDKIQKAIMFLTVHDLDNDAG
jgi:hypothetical protein